MFKFTRDDRLIKKDQFRDILDTGKKVQARYFLMIVKANTCQRARLGVIVAKKSFKLAVTRNCIKRIVRESFRACKNQIPALDIIIIIRQATNTLSKKQLRTELDKTWSNLQC